MLKPRDTQESFSPDLADTYSLIQHTRENTDLITGAIDQQISSFLEVYILVTSPP